MLQFVFRRLLFIALALLFVSALTFGLVFAGPADPARALTAGKASGDALEQLRAQYGLDRPVPEQYARYMSQLLRGDLGYSYVYRRSVSEMLLTRLPATLLLATSIMFVALIIGIPLGVLMAMRQNSMLDRSLLLGGTMLISLPAFLLGLLLLYVFAFQLKWFPLGGHGSLSHLVLPTLAVALPWSIWYATLLRSNMLNVRNADYVRTGQAKGLPMHRVALRHMLPNALVPVLTMASMDLAALLTGIALVERVFNWPGIGQLALDANSAQDVPVIMGCVLFGALMIGAGNLMADLIAARLDPRIRLTT
jgi:peptide/nickel transport system permease protein